MKTDDQLEQESLAKSGDNSGWLLGSAPRVQYVSPLFHKTEQLACTHDPLQLGGQQFTVTALGLAGSMRLT